MKEIRLIYFGFSTWSALNKIDKFTTSARNSLFGLNHSTSRQFENYLQQRDDQTGLLSDKTILVRIRSEENNTSMAQSVLEQPSKSTSFTRTKQFFHFCLEI